MTGCQGIIKARTVQGLKRGPRRCDKPATPGTTFCHQHTPKSLPATEARPVYDPPCPHGKDATGHCGNLTCTEARSVVHIFEQAGLGKAPFHIVGVEVRRGPYTFIDPKSGVEVSVGSPGQPMGTCNYCGQGIAECWKIQSADGRTFIVGCDCVRKTGDAGMKKAIDQHASDARRERIRLRIQSARGLLETEKVKAVLATMPHPAAERSLVFKTKTLLDWAQWMMDHAGAIGKLQVARVIEKVRS